MSKDNREQTYPPTKATNYHLIVDVSEPFLVLGDLADAWRRRSRDVRESIKRHVDNVGDIDVEYDLVCTFCGGHWEVEKSDGDPDCPKGMPLCCEKAIQAWHIHTAHKGEPCQFCGQAHDDVAIGPCPNRIE